MQRGELGKVSAAETGVPSDLLGVFYYSVIHYSRTSLCRISMSRISCCLVRIGLLLVFHTKTYLLSRILALFGSHGKLRTDISCLHTNSICYLGFLGLGSSYSGG
jgi:hypothetical protein